MLTSHQRGRMPLNTARKQSQQPMHGEDARPISLPTRETGTVKWFSKEKSYGFISRRGEEDAFVHAGDVNAELRQQGGLEEGLPVEFEVRVGPKGPRALNVTISK